MTSFDESVGGLIKSENTLVDREFYLFCGVNDIQDLENCSLMKCLQPRGVEQLQEGRQPEQKEMNPNHPKSSVH